MDGEKERERGGGPARINICRVNASRKEAPHFHKRSPSVGRARGSPSRQIPLLMVWCSRSSRGISVQKIAVFTAWAALHSPSLSTQHGLVRPLVFVTYWKVVASDGD